MKGMSNADMKAMGMRPDYPRNNDMPQWGPFVRNPDSDTPQGDAWTNGRYDCVVALFLAELPTGEQVTAKRLQICNFDQSARHDWRDFQRIKNELIGPEWEAVELYPAESRLRDPSNAFYLWCFPAHVFSWLGFQSRLVCDADQAIAPQRKLPK